ncbi:MAG: hypothetical protein K2G55_09930, partial [Lachnospiraceae bacterium]|nr:hypothetical protein [Lachnospiraceae bacterium]
MYKWEKLFDSVALTRAKTIDSSRIMLMNKDETHIDAAVMVMGARAEVSITLKEGVPLIMKCKCPKARSGRRCEHMAAVLYKIEQEKKTAEESVSEQTDINDFQEMWDTAVASETSKEKAENPTDTKSAIVNKTTKTKSKPSRTSAAQKTEKVEAAETKAEEPTPKKRGRKSKAQLEAERAAAEEAAKQAKKEETERRIAERKAQKAAQKAERKRKRAEAEEAQR